MKQVKFLFLFAFVAMTVLIAKAQVAGNINETTFFKAKYKKDKVWDVQRSPAFPIAGQEWTLSGLKGSLDANGATVDWGQDRYLMLVAEVDNSNSANSLVNDVNRTGGKYNVSLKLFESNGTLVKVVSEWGKIAGIGDKGFMYEVEGMFGTFFSVAAVPSTTVIKYKPTLGTVTKLSEIVNTSELTKSLELAKGITDSPFFSNKYTKENVWDVQRSPAYPIAGQEWTLSGLSNALDANGVNLDWGVGRYVMLVAEVDNTNGPNSLVDDINKNGTKLNISLKLYESNGRLVKVVSKWGKIYGIGAEGFMYELEGKYGTFFSVAKVSSSTVVKYRPTLGAVTKLSDVTKGLNVTGQESIKVPELSKSITETPFFSNKYTKENVWDVQRSPAYPIVGQVWTLSGLKGSLESSGASVDWGVGRYVMLVAEIDNQNAVTSIVDDINKNGSKYNISLKLFESNGTLVKVISKWGKIYGVGAEGFMYEIEGKFGTFFSVASVNSSTEIKYKPGVAEVSKLSQLTKGLDVVKVPELPKITTESSKAQIEKGLYTITSKCSGKVLEKNESNKFRASVLVQLSLNATTSQPWKIDPMVGSPNHYTLTAINQVLDVKADGVEMMLVSKNGSPHQHWKIELVAGSPGYFTIISRASGKALEVKDASTLDGADIQLSTPNGSAAQQWKFDKVK